MISSSEASAISASNRIDISFELSGIEKEILRSAMSGDTSVIVDFHYQDKVVKNEILRTLSELKYGVTVMDGRIFISW